jgi:hypothetical protein
MRFLRDVVIEWAARQVGMDPIWFCVTVCGVLLLGAIVYTEVGVARNRPRRGRPS